MNIEKFREIIKERIYVEKISKGEWQDGIDKCWKKEIEILSEDIPSSIYFLTNDCTEDEYSWISEIIEDLAEKTGSKELIQCYKNLMVKFPNACKTYNIAESIKYAEDVLNGGADGS